MFKLIVAAIVLIVAFQFFNVKDEVGNQINFSQIEQEKHKDHLLKIIENGGSFVCSYSGMKDTFDKSSNFKIETDAFGLMTVGAGSIKYEILSCK